MRQSLPLILKGALVSRCAVLIPMAYETAWNDSSMVSIVIALYVVSALSPVAGLVLAWRAARRAVRQSTATVELLEQIEAKYDSRRAQLPPSQQWSGPAHDKLVSDQHAEESRAGRVRFTYGQMDRAPHYVTQMILSHLAQRFPTEIALIIVGLIAGAVASIWSLWL